MATYGKRQVIQKGRPEITEDGTAGGAITPGYLVKGVYPGSTAIVVQNATTAVPIAKTWALERDEFGTGIDSTYAGTNVGTPSPNYASGDTVKVGHFAPGQRLTAWVASGANNISKDDSLESAGDGTLRKLASGTAIARALDAVTVTNLSAPVTFRVEVL